MYNYIIFVVTYRQITIQQPTNNSTWTLCCDTVTSICGNISWSFRAAFCFSLKTAIDAFPDIFCEKPKFPYSEFACIFFAIYFTVTLCMFIGLIRIYWDPHIYIIAFHLLFIFLFLFILWGPFVLHTFLSIFALVPKSDPVDQGIFSSFCDTQFCS